MRVGLEKSMTKILSALLAMVLVVLLLPANIASADTKYPYKIKINKGTNVVTIYTSDGDPYTAFTCSVGWATPTGTYKTKEKYTWHELMGPSYGQYCTRITEGILFHSVWYYTPDKDNQSYSNYNKLGELASHGCCRLTVAAAKWIYDNCPTGTEVKIFNGDSKDDPLGKPKTISVSGYSGWDPTDPDPKNPYKTGSKKPVITVKSTAVQLGKGLTKKNLKVVDSNGFDITGWKGIKIMGFNPKKLGAYQTEISLVDSCGRMATKKVTYIVTDKKKYTIDIKNTSLRKKYNSSLDLMSGVKCYNTNGEKVNEKVKVYIKKPSKNEYTYIGKPSSKYVFDELGTYKIKYTATNSNNGLIREKIRTVEVYDGSAPKLDSSSDWQDIVISDGAIGVSWDDLMSDVTAKTTATELDITKNTVVYVQKGFEDVAKLKSGKSKKIPAGSYTVYYEIENEFEFDGKTRKLIIADAQANTEA